MRSLHALVQRAHAYVRFFYKLNSQTTRVRVRGTDQSSIGMTSWSWSVPRTLPTPRPHSITCVSYMLLIPTNAKHEICRLLAALRPAICGIMATRLVEMDRGEEE